MQLILSFYKDCRENKVTNRSNLQIKLKFVHAGFREDGKTGEGENGQRKTSQRGGDPKNLEKQSFTEKEEMWVTRSSPK